MLFTPESYTDKIVRMTANIRSIQMSRPVNCIIPGVIYDVCLLPAGSGVRAD